MVSVFDLQGVDERWIDGDGLAPTSLIYVAEAPAMNEVREGRALVGPSGAVNWFMAGRYGRVGREGAWVTNWSKLPLTAKQKKDGIPQEDSDAWDALLASELEMVADPEGATIIALGQYAVRSLLGGEYNTYWTNGIPIQRGNRVVIPVVHPAAGFHSPDKLADTMHGYLGVRAYLNGDLPARPWGQWRGNPDITVLSGSWALPDNATVTEVAIDTEGSPARPYMLTFSTAFGNFLIRAADGAALRSFRAMLERHRPALVLQNAVYDATVIRNMAGVNIWDYQVHDTLVDAFNLQNIPRDLKNMSRRELGVNMLEYEALVRPFQEAADSEWKTKLAEVVYGLVTTEQALTPKGKPRFSKGQPVMVRTGDPRAMSILKHLEGTRAGQQQLTADEQAWAEGQIGRRPGLDLSLVPDELAIPYAGKDSAVTLELGPILLKRVQDAGLEEVNQIDHDALPLIEDMQQTGLHMDVERYWDVLGHVSTRRREVIAEIQQLVNQEGFNSPDFNPASGDQVADFCRFIYDRDKKLKLTKLTKSRERESTDNNTLSQLRDEHPFINLELEFKELDKYEGTYLLPMKDYMRQMPNGEWRVFFNLRSTTVVSGRLSAHAPNVLAWPARTKLGLRLRGIFTAPPVMALASWDLSQIELRLAAWASQDAVMLDAFVRGLDLHTNLASKLFGIPYDQVTHCSKHERGNSPQDQRDCQACSDRKQAHRSPTKTIHYLLLYGGQGDKLFEELRGMGITSYSRQDCFDMIRDTWNVYTGVKQYMRGVAQELREKGFVSDFTGRRRFLPGAQLSGEWPMKSLRLESERQAGNFKFQAGAAALLKRTMKTVYREVYPELKRQGVHFRLWLQVHDELFGELDPQHWELVDRLMRAAMTQDSWMTAPVPIETEGKMGASWGELK